FTLNAVGGVVGINHGIDAAALGRAISAGTAEAMLFPSDPVRQADTVLPQLAACFPFRQGSWVVGPTLAMGWGTPTLITAKAAVLISDSEVAVVGNLAVTLPHKDAALIVLKATIL